MRLLILGALGPYPERLSTFTEAGHELWYVSTERLSNSNDFPGGITACQWQDLGATVEEAAKAVLLLIETHKIEAVYSLLNVWDGSNRATAALLEQGCPVPVVRHYKEHYSSPSAMERTCLEKSTGVIFINQESRDYFAALYQLPELVTCLDADLIPRRYLSGDYQPKLSAADHTPHLLIAGSVSDDNGRYDYRQFIGELSHARIHVHLYAQFRMLASTGQLNNTSDVRAAYEKVGREGFVHFHQPIPPSRFVEEWSKYDAGLLHVPRPDDPFRHLNLPNRYSAYLAAGVPVAVPAGAMPAMERVLTNLEAGIIFHGVEDLLERLPDEGASQRAKAVRQQVTFDAVFPQLMEFMDRCCGYR